MSNIHAVIFDLGGVLLRHPKSPNTVLLSSIFKQPYQKIHAFYEKTKNDLLCGNNNIDTFLLLYCNKYKSTLTTDQIKDMWKKQYRILRSADSTMISILKDLKGHTIRCVLSNNTPLNYEANKEDGIFDYFEKEFISFRMGVCKPDRKIYEKTIAALSIPPSAILFIDDKQENLKPAKELGMNTYHFDILKDNPVQLRRFLTNNGVFENIITSTYENNG
jgi:epoxide hydrolase-like predicted phosphatase